MFLLKGEGYRRGERSNSEPKKFHERTAGLMWASAPVYASLSLLHSRILLERVDKNISLKKRKTLNLSTGQAIPDLTKIRAGFYVFRLLLFVLIYLLCKY